MKNKIASTALILCFLSLIAVTGAQEEQKKEDSPQTTEAPEPMAPELEGPAEAGGPMPPDMTEVMPEEPVASNETVLIDDSLPEGATAEGNWVWDDTLKASGDKSHTEPLGTGLYGHSFKLVTPLKISEGANIIQDVYLDPQNPPKGIVLKFKLNTGEEVGVYWEGPEEAVTNIIGDEELLWYQDELPKAGEWVKLEIPASEAEIENEELVGISYLALDGKLNWDKTAIVEGAKEEGDIGVEEE